MNNLKYFPFERINYYSGKLLTEQDFIKEQQYMNDKRRLHNRFFHGIGVVAGMQVMMINENSLSLEDGVAIDFAGREILIDAPGVHKLSSIDGFQKMAEENNADYVYLCIEYHEKSNMQARGASSTLDYSAMNIDKNSEGYRLYLTNQEPKDIELEAEDLLIKSSTIFENNELKIQQLFYKAVVSGEHFKTSIKVLNKGNVSKITVNIKEVLEGAFLDNKAECNFEFDNLILERGEEKEITVLLKAKALEYGTINLHIASENMKIIVNDETIKNTERKKIAIPVVKENIIDYLKKDYFSKVMESVITNNYPRGIYLAKIFLTRREASYAIENIISMPFNQYVYSATLMENIVKELERSVIDLKANIRELEGRKSFDVIPVVEKEKEEKGTLEIELPFPAKAGQVFYSKEIYHNLGMGHFKVSLIAQESDILYVGEGDIFQDRKIKAKLAVKHNTKTASFVVGLKLLENTNENAAVFKYVVEKGEEEVQENAEYIHIIPSKLEVKKRETYCLEAICESVPGATVLWSVNGMSAGSIAVDGTYTAPNNEGVFEIIATCEQKPELKASLFVVVRE